MRTLLVLLTSTLFVAPAAAHPGMEEGPNSVHDTLHMIGGFDLVLAAIAVGLVAYFGTRILRSGRVRRK